LLRDVSRSVFAMETGRAKVDLAEIVPVWAKVLDVAAFDVDTFCVATLAVALGPTLQLFAVWRSPPVQLRKWL